ncbi:MAG TPA: Uma2 family endonuclease [Saprospiraceae bacterium]|nr:Uma2 family endonuclease [Saprospiraceae bacterium]HMP22872.1 Uma2 family endonuclease [Saprospiraceae bacterium]
MITDIEQLSIDKVYSYADYLTWRFEERVEIIKGKLIRISPAPNRRHQRISFQITSQLARHFENNPCEVYYAPFDVRLLDSKKSHKADQEIYSVVQPDICVICDRSKLDDRGCLGAPDWIIEIISRGNSKKELDDKYRLYEANGVREYWIVHPNDQTIAAFELHNDQYRLRRIYSSEENAPVGIFKDLVLDLEAVFQD